MSFANLIFQVLKGLVPNLPDPLELISKVCGPSSAEPKVKITLCCDNIDFQVRNALCSLWGCFHQAKAIVTWLSLNIEQVLYPFVCNAKAKSIHVSLSLSGKRHSNSNVTIAIAQWKRSIRVYSH